MLAAAAASPAPTAAPEKVLAPAEIVASAPAADWLAIAPSDLLVMDLAPDAAGRARRVVIQLMPAPFSQGWVGNIRKLAAAHWWDGTSINRAQDNYVVQWGDADGEDKAKAKALPEGLVVVDELYYENNPSERFTRKLINSSLQAVETILDRGIACIENAQDDCKKGSSPNPPGDFFRKGDPYAVVVGFAEGWPYAGGYDRRGRNEFWPIHCYGTVGVGRDYPPDTGTGAELYAVIGHAPRQLDRNIAVVGRVIEGMEHLSTLPRGTGDLGFYKTAPERTPIRSVRIGTEVPDLPAFEYLSTESASFARYADARANRRDAFYIQPAGGVDICNVPVPIRRRK